jgi:DNA-binding XRE family transcriptional regulator
MSPCEQTPLARARHPSYVELRVFVIVLMVGCLLSLDSVRIASARSGKQTPPSRPWGYLAFTLTCCRMPRPTKRTREGVAHPVRDWRRMYGIKQQVLAREADLNVITLSRIENGAEPSVTNAIGLCRALSRLAGREISVYHVFDDPDDSAFYEAEREVHRAQASADLTRRD